MTHKFDNAILSGEDFTIWLEITGGRDPDLVIAPAGRPYLYRWHITDHKHMAVHGQWFFHVQVDDDDDRGLHDHPWDNTSVIISGGYDEQWNPTPWLYGTKEEVEHHAVIRSLRKGDMVHRVAGEAHRLVLPSYVPYTMTMFSTGPTKGPWGFYLPEGWRDHNELVKVENNKAFFNPHTHNGRQHQ
jgi:hypothetical protein